MEKNNQLQKIQQSGYLLPTLGILAICLVFGGGYYLLNNNLVAANPAPEAVPVVQNERTNWRSYTNTEAKFTFQHPLDWTVMEETHGEYKRVLAKGNQGQITIDFGTGFGGYCQTEWTEFKLGNINNRACHFIQDGIENWNLEGFKRDNLGFAGFIQANSPYADNRDVILKILSTFEFEN